MIDGRTRASRSGRGTVGPVRGRWLLGLLLSVSLVVGVAFLVLRGDEQHAQLSTPSSSARPDRVAATAELIFELQRALTAPHGARPSEVADPDLASAEAEVAALAANARRLRVDRLMLRYLDDADLELSTAQRDRFGAGAWVTEVQLSWRFRGVDEAVSTLEVPIVTDWEGDRAVFVTSRVTGDSRVPLWFFDDLAVRRTPGTLVLAEDAATARTLSRQASAAVRTVRRILPTWDEPLVIEAPGSAADFRTVSGLDHSESRTIAAVTTATDGSSIDRAPVHVYLNPDVYGPLGPVGGQIVVTHEAAHVALDGTRTSLPLWLSEGMADYVALTDTPLPDTVLAAQIRELVREQGARAALPGPAEFDGSNRDIGAWYEAAWLAVRLLADTYGQRALLQFYRAAEADGDVQRAFRQVLGTTEAEFRRAWHAELAQLARR